MSQNNSATGKPESEPGWGWKLDKLVRLSCAFPSESQIPFPRAMLAQLRVYWIGTWGFMLVEEKEWFAAKCLSNGRRARLSWHVKGSQAGRSLCVPWGGSWGGKEDESTTGSPACSFEQAQQGQNFGRDQKSKGDHLKMTLLLPGRVCRFVAALMDCGTASTD